MTLLPTTADSDEKKRSGYDQKSGEHERRKARSAHANAKAVLRVLFKVARPGSGRAHRYYRAILRGSSGAFHLAGGHVIVTSGGEYAEDTAADSEPPLWLERDVGLRNALHAVNGFVPAHRSGDTYVATQFLSGESTCRMLWEWVKRQDGEENGDRNPSLTITPEPSAPPSKMPAQTHLALLSQTPLRPRPRLYRGDSGSQNSEVRSVSENSSITKPSINMNTHSENNIDNENIEDTNNGLKNLSQSKMINHLRTWLKTYAEAIWGVQMLADTTIEFEDGSQTDVDALLRLRDAAGGESQVVGNRVERAPELVVKMLYGATQIDMFHWGEEHSQKGVTESITLNEEETITWNSPGIDKIYDDNQILSGTMFPGLEIHLEHFYDDDLSAQISQLRERLDSDAHQRFEEELKSRE